jgi:hypothetical protein
MSCWTQSDTWNFSSRLFLSEFSVSSFFKIRGFLCVIKLNETWRLMPSTCILLSSLSSNFKRSWVHSWISYAEVLEMTFPKAQITVFCLSQVSCQHKNITSFLKCQVTKHKRQYDASGRLSSSNAPLDDSNQTPPVVACNSVQAVQSFFTCL